MKNKSNTSFFGKHTANVLFRSRNGSQIVVRKCAFLAETQTIVGEVLAWALALAKVGCRLAVFADEEISAEAVTATPLHAIVADAELAEALPPRRNPRGFSSSGNSSGVQSIV